MQPYTEPRLQAMHSERPRERLLRHGANVLTSAELLAIILRTGMNGCDAVMLGHRLLLKFGNLRNLLNADQHSLLATPGLGQAKVCELLAIHELHRRITTEELRSGEVLNQPQRVKDYCIAHLGHLKIEHCMALYLDSQFQLISSEEVARGTLTQASVYPREIIKSALKHHAAALILAHNHPSGVKEPSRADLHLTQHLQKALSLVDIRLLDHLIVTATEATSLAEQGHI